jgi:3-deoxy-D-manno-octulosonic-acid transferase
VCRLLTNQRSLSRGRHTECAYYILGMDSVIAYLFDILYCLALLAASPWLFWKSWRTGKYRAGFREKFFGLIPPRQSNRPCIWFHAVSVGEVNLLAPLLAKLAATHPDCECVVSTTTMTGYALANKKYSGTTVFYCPLDFSWAVRNALTRIRPTALVLAELELWPNLVRLVHAAGVRVAIVNGRLSDRSFRGYRRARWLIAPLLLRLDLIAAQNDEYANRFLALGARPDAVQVTGSIKFDGAQADRANPATRRLANLAAFSPDDFVFLAGSTQEPEETLAIQTFRALSPEHPRLRLVIAPRHPERFAEVAALLDACGLAWQKRSELLIARRADARILLVDTVGELGAWWGTASVGFVGGSLSSRGGQNMIEPAAYGAPICFGPNTQNFRDVVAALVATDAAVVVRSGEELTAFVRRTLDDQAFAAGLGGRARDLVAQQRGATDRTLALLSPLVGVQPLGCALPQRAA